MSAIDKLAGSLLHLAQMTSQHLDGAVKHDFFEGLSAISQAAAELASPILPESYDDPTQPEKTLRDEFAMHAPSMPPWYGVGDCMITIVDWRYAYADAMLAVRKSPP